METPGNTGRRHYVNHDLTDFQFASLVRPNLPTPPSPQGRGRVPEGGREEAPAACFALLP